MLHFWFGAMRLVLFVLLFCVSFESYSLPPLTFAGAGGAKISANEAATAFGFLGRTPLFPAVGVVVTAVSVCQAISACYNVITNAFKPSVDWSGSSSPPATSSSVFFGMSGVGYISADKACGSYAVPKGWGPCHVGSPSACLTTSLSTGGDASCGVYTSGCPVGYSKSVSGGCSLSDASSVKWPAGTDVLTLPTLAALPDKSGLGRPVQDPLPSPSGMSLPPFKAISNGLPGLSVEGNDTFGNYIKDTVGVLADGSLAVTRKTVVAPTGKDSEYTQKDSVSISPNGAVTSNKSVQYPGSDDTPPPGQSQPTDPGGDSGAGSGSAPVNIDLSPVVNAINNESVSNATALNVVNQSVNSVNDSIGSVNTAIGNAVTSLRESVADQTTALSNNLSGVNTSVNNAGTAVVGSVNGVKTSVTDGTVAVVGALEGVKTGVSAQVRDSAVSIVDAVSAVRDAVVNLPLSGADNPVGNVDVDLTPVVSAINNSAQPPSPDIPPALDYQLSEKCHLSYIPGIMLPCSGADALPDFSSFLKHDFEGGSCPAGISFSVLGGDFVLSFDRLCEVAGIVGNLLLAASWFSAYRIAARGVASVT